MLVSVAAAMLLFAAPETAQPAETPASAPATKSTDAKPSSAKKVCYNATPSGSRLQRRVCVTQAPAGEEKPAEKAPEPK